MTDTGQYNNIESYDRLTDAVSDETAVSTRFAMKFSDFITDMMTPYEDDTYDVALCKRTLDIALTFPEKMIFILHMYMDDYAREASIYGIDKRILMTAIKRMNYKIRKVRDTLKKKPDPLFI